MVEWSGGESNVDTRTQHPVHQRVFQLLPAAACVDDVDVPTTTTNKTICTYMGIDEKRGYRDYLPYPIHSNISIV